MRFDVISDLHLDLWTNKKNGKWLKLFIDKIVPIREERSEILVIAGDLGHSNTQNYNAVRFLKEFYKNIVVVHGNHDLYLIHEESVDTYQCDSFCRLVDLQKKLGSIDGVHFLNGSSVEIDGVTFGGTVGWYDGVFAEREHNFTPERIDQMWRHFADCRWIYTPDGTTFDWRSYYQGQRRAMEDLTDYCDVMITHHVPIWEKMRMEFRNDPSSGFFHFDGYDLVEKMTGKVWVYGHTHDQYFYEYKGCQMVCNPLGYDGEFFNGDWREFEKLPRMIRTVEI